MPKIIKQLSILFFALIPTCVYAYPEIPFCPAGGPPGWINYLNKKNHNNWHNRNYQTSYYPNIYRSNQSYPTVNNRHYYAPPYHYKYNPNNYTRYFPKK